MSQLKAGSASEIRNPLAAGFSDFIRRISKKLGAPDEAAHAASAAAFACMEALSEGSVCTDLWALSASTTKPGNEITDLLLRSGVFMKSDENLKKPMVIDERGRIYLYRYFDYETQLANALLGRISSDAIKPVNQKTLQFIGKRFEMKAGSSDRQKIAVMKALTSPLTIISGGPGTGKTTIVTALIAALVLNEPGSRIALAAPTGKAAAKMEDTIRKQINMMSPDWISRMPDRASTLHMLLGARPQTGEFRFNRNHPLPCDVVIVDEASMIDLSLAAHLFSALSPGARVVLLGDKDQLASVEAGAIFAELAGQSSLSLQDPGCESGAMSDCVVWLKENYRFDAESPVGKMARLVIEGNDKELTKWIQSQQSDILKWENVGDGLPLKLADELVDGYETYVAAVRCGDPEQIFKAHKYYCILCAIRHGQRGVDGINEAVTQKLRPKLERGKSGELRWYHGRPVMITENDYDHDIFNGDIGITLVSDDGNVEVWFEKKEGGIHRLVPSMLPAHETAFAMTVHKAQGSEFEKVALVLPEHDIPVLTRELVYTAVTRARKNLAIYGSPKILAAAVARPTLRNGALAERIRSMQLK